MFTAPNVLLVASGLGVYRSVDGAVNFGSNPPLFNNTNPIIAGDATDLDVDTASNTIVYASISGSGVFKSTDSGVTFPASGNLFTATNGAPTQIGYVAFTQSTLPNNRTMYANVALVVSGTQACLNPRIVAATGAGSPPRRTI